MTDTQPLTIPYNREAEEALIGSVLINPEAYYDVADFLRSEDFYIHRHRWIWDAFSRLQDAHTPLDFLTLSEELERAGCLGELGGPAYLTQLINSTPTSMHAEAYGRIIVETAMRRRMLQAAGDIAKLAYQRNENADWVASQAERTLQAASERWLHRPARPLGEIVSELFDDIEIKSRNPSSNQSSGIPTGFVDLDRLLGGLHASDVLVVAGRPGMGKTAFSLSIIRHVAQVRQQRVLLFSLEMGAEQIATRLTAQVSGIDSSRIRDGRLYDQEWPAFAQAISDLADLPIMIDDTSTLNPLQLLTRCRRVQREQGLDLVVVDYLQLMTAGGRFENRNQEISHISRQLKVLARELNIPVLAAAQLSRAVEQRADKRPMLSDLRESGSIEQDADVVMFLYRPDPTAGTSQVEVEIAKHRNGPVGAVKLVFNPSLTRFDNAA